MQRQINRRRFLSSAAMAAAAQTLLGTSPFQAFAGNALAGATQTASAADAEQRRMVNAFFRSFYKTKDNLDAPAFAAHVADPNIYNDAILSGHCGAPSTRKAFEERFAGIFARFSGPGKFSAFVHATGDVRYGAMVEYVDVKGSIFEVDLDLLTVMEMKGGLVSQDIDYWDSWQLTQADISEGGEVTTTDVALPLAPVHKGGTPRQAKPCTPAVIPGDTPHASPEMAAFARRYQDAVRSGRGDRVAGFFTDDAVLIHPLLHQGPPGYAGYLKANIVQGRADIAKFLAAGLALLPDGVDASITNIVGGTSGGGFEWRAGGPYSGQGLTREGIRGATAIDLADGNIERLSVRFDTMHLTAAQRQALTAALTSIRRA
jgi:ketosteroid isomerase-like protein